MKNIWTLTFLLLLYASGSVSAQDTKTYTSDSLKFSLDVPKSWQIIENYNNQAALLALSPRIDGLDDFSENINLIIDATDLTGITVEYYRDLSAEGLKGALKDATIDSVSSDTLANGLIAGVISYSHSLPSYRLKALVYLFIKDNTGYIITCTAKKDAYYEYKEQFTKICRSLTLK